MLSKQQTQTLEQLSAAATESQRAYQGNPEGSFSADWLRAEAAFATACAVAYRTGQLVAVQPCTSCHGMNTSCPDGCGRDPKTGELNGTRLVAVQPEQPTCMLCAGKCRGHSLADSKAWEPEPGSQAFAVQPDDAVGLVASALMNAPVGHPFPDGSRQTFTDALCDGINFDPNDDSAATIYETVRSLATTVIAAMKGPKP